MLKTFANLFLLLTIDEYGAKGQTLIVYLKYDVIEPLKALDNNYPLEGRLWAYAHNESSYKSYPPYCGERASHVADANMYQNAWVTFSWACHRARLAEDGRIVAARKSRSPGFALVWNNLMRLAARKTAAADDIHDAEEKGEGMPNISLIFRLETGTEANSRCVNLQESLDTLNFYRNMLRVEVTVNRALFWPCKSLNQ